MDALPKIEEGTNQEVRSLIESERLMGRGMGFLDAHLLYSVLNHAGALLWTHDRRLAQIAQELSISYQKRP